MADRAAREPDSSLMARVLRYRDVALNGIRLLGEYAPRSFNGDLLLFTPTREPSEALRLAEAWQPYIQGRVENYDIDSTHIDMTSPRPVSEIGSVLSRKLRELDGE